MQEILANLYQTIPVMISIRVFVGWWVSGERQGDVLYFEPLQTSRHFARSCFGVLSPIKRIVYTRSLW